MRKILIADDSPMARFYIRKCLEAVLDTEIKISEAGDGSAALGELVIEKPDLLITDINMPGMDGHELIQKLKGDAALSKIPIIVISSLGKKAQADKCLSLGAASVILKPFDPEKLGEHIKEIF